MKIIGQIIHKGRKISTSLLLNQAKASKTQLRTLRKLIKKAENTAFGSQYNFDQILDSEEIYSTFCENVPVSDYSKMFPWWQRAYNGEENVTWPGKVDYFALSSGTSEGSSKYIPVTPDMLKAIRKASLRQILSIAKSDFPKDFFAKDYVMIGGSTDLNFDGKVYSGDLSGITTQNLPYWFEKFSRPSLEIRSTKNWNEKIDKITQEAKNWDVVMIAGVPAWIQLLFENIIRVYNLETIHDIWPNLSIYIHGGVAIEPYKKAINSLCSKPIMYFETYLASEGFIAYQSNEKATGMRLLFRNDMYYEFVPFNKENFHENGEIRSGVEALNISQVVENKEYAILLTTCAGAWRYLIGDVIRFTDVENCEIKITGRTKHYLSLCGEHLSVDNMNKAMEKLSEIYNQNFVEFTVKGIPFENLFAHEWYIGAENIETLNNIEVANKLDEILKELNDDYATERLHALKSINVKIIPNELFVKWLEKRGKLGSQNKFPRVLSDDLFYNWKEFVESHGSNIKVS
jgi:hypothetical protein